MQAQTDTAGDSASLYLPPIDTLFAWAAMHSPALKQQDALIEKSEADTRRVEKQWLDAIKISANYQSGSYGNTVIDQVNTGYNFGPYISFSLYDIFSNKDLVHVYKAEEQVAVYKKEETSLELRKVIIVYYNNVLSQQDILKIRSEGLNDAYLHFQMAEKEFSEGAIPVSELSRVSEIYTKAQADYAETFNALKTNYMLLEQMCGVTFGNENK